MKLMRFAGLMGAGVLAVGVTGCSQNGQSLQSDPSRSALSSLWAGATGEEALLICASQAIQVIEAVKPQSIEPAVLSEADEFYPVNKTHISFTTEREFLYPSLKIRVSDIHALDNERRMFDGVSSARVTFNLNVVPATPTQNPARDNLANEVAENVSSCLLKSASLPSYNAATRYFQGSKNTLDYSITLSSLNR